MTDDMTTQSPEEAAVFIYEEIQQYMLDPNATRFGGVQWIAAHIKQQRNAAVKEYVKAVPQAPKPFDKRMALEILIKRQGEQIARLTGEVARLRDALSEASENFA